MQTFSLFLGFHVHGLTVPILTHSQRPSSKELEKKFTNDPVGTSSHKAFFPCCYEVEKTEEMDKEQSSALSGREVTVSKARVLPVPLIAPAPAPSALKSSNWQPNPQSERHRKNRDGSR